MAQLQHRVVEHRNCAGDDLAQFAARFQVAGTAHLSGSGLELRLRRRASATRRDTGQLVEAAPCAVGEVLGCGQIALRDCPPQVLPRELALRRARVAALRLGRCRHRAQHCPEHGTDQSLLQGQALPRQLWMYVWMLSLEFHVGCAPRRSNASARLNCIVRNYLTSFALAGIRRGGSCERRAEIVVGDGGTVRRCGKAASTAELPLPPRETGAKCRCHDGEGGASVRWQQCNTKAFPTRGAMREDDRATHCSGNATHLPRPASRKLTVGRSAEEQCAGDQIPGASYHRHRTERRCVRDALPLSLLGAPRQVKEGATRGHSGNGIYRSRRQGCRSGAR